MKLAAVNKTPFSDRLYTSSDRLYKLIESKGCYIAEIHGLQHGEVKMIVKKLKNKR